MNRSSVLYYWMINRIRSIAAVFGLFGSMCALCITLLAIAVLLVISLIPLYLNRNAGEALGELYCVNNYSMVVAFELPQYNTTFTDQFNNGAYSFTQYASNAVNGICGCVDNLNISASEKIQVNENCLFQMLSIIYPAIPNAAVFNSYALSEACYRTLQSCDYDPFLFSCLLSNCIVVTSLNASTNGSYPLTSYRLQCTANIYYKTRCTDAASSFHLYYSASRQNSACRQQRLNRINTCLNSSVQLSDVPCLITVSSGRFTNTTATCTQTVILANTNLQFLNTSSTINTIPFTAASTVMSTQASRVFTTAVFAASDQTDGHVYRISSINSETYMSSQLGALYCGGVTHTQIATSITASINSQSSG